MHLLVAIFAFSTIVSQGLCNSHHHRPQPDHHRSPPQGHHRTQQGACRTSIECTSQDKKMCCVFNNNMDRSLGRGGSCKEYGGLEAACLKSNAELESRSQDRYIWTCPCDDNHECRDREMHPHGHQHGHAHRHQRDRASRDRQPSSVCVRKPTTAPSSKPEYGMTSPFAVTTGKALTTNQSFSDLQTKPPTGSSTPTSATASSFNSVSATSPKTSPNYVTPESKTATSTLASATELPNQSIRGTASIQYAPERVTVSYTEYEKARTTTFTPETTTGVQATKSSQGAITGATTEACACAKRTTTTSIGNAVTNSQTTKVPAPESTTASRSTANGQVNGTGQTTKSFVTVNGTGATTTKSPNAVTGSQTTKAPPPGSTTGSRATGNSRENGTGETTQSIVTVNGAGVSTTKSPDQKPVTDGQTTKYPSSETEKGNESDLIYKILEEEAKILKEVKILEEEAKILEERAKILKEEEKVLKEEEMLEAEAILAAAN